MAKGGAFEREVSREITEWLTGERNPPQVWRSTQSGGWKYGTDIDKGDLQPKGDVGAEFLSMFSVECKHQKFNNNYDFWYAFSRGDNAPFWKWWVKITREAVEYHTIPLLIMKRNHYPTLIGTPDTFLYQSNLPRVGVAGLTDSAPNVTFYMWDTYRAQVTYNDMKEGYRAWEDELNGWVLSLKKT